MSKTQQEQLSESDIIDPEILKPPQKKKSLPDPPMKPATPPTQPPAANPPRMGKATPTPAAPTSDSKGGSADEHLYEACIPRSTSNALPPEIQALVAKNSSLSAPSNPDEHHYANSMVVVGGATAPLSSAPPSAANTNQVDISARYETAFPHHVVTVPPQADGESSSGATNSTSAAPPPDSTPPPHHEYVNLDVTATKKKSTGQKPALPKKSPTLVKKPVPIQRKRAEPSSQDVRGNETSTTDESGSCYEISGRGAKCSEPSALEGGADGVGVTSPTSNTKTSPVLGQFDSSPTPPKKPLPPAKPLRLQTGNSLTSLQTATTPPKEGVVSPPTFTAAAESRREDRDPRLANLGDGRALKVVPTAGSDQGDRTRPLSSDLSELGADHASSSSSQTAEDAREQEMSSSVDSVTMKPRSYTSGSADRRRIDRETNKQPLVPPPGSSQGEAPPPSSKATPPSLRATVSTGRLEQLRVQQQERRPPPSAKDTPTKPLPLPNKTKINPPTTTAESAAAAAPSGHLEKSGSTSGKTAPPQKPPRIAGGHVRVGGPPRPGGVAREEEGTPKGREELMKKLSLRRLRIEEQLSNSSSRSRGITSPPTTAATPTTSAATPTASQPPPPPAEAGGVAKSEATPTNLESVSEERNSGISTSSSLSEVIVAYHAKKSEMGGSSGTYTSADSSMSSSNGAAMGGASGCGLSAAEVVLRRTGGKDEASGENLSKFGIVEDVSGGSYVI